MLDLILSKIKAKVKDLEQLAGYLNFLNKAIVPGRAFTRRMYAKFSYVKTNLKQYHHIILDKEFKEDCRIWKQFLDENNSQSILRPFIDLDLSFNVTQLRFYTDASANGSLGFGCLFNEEWCFKQWEPGFIQQMNPSIEFLELYALCVGIFTWVQKLNNKRIIVFCDNETVVGMINNTTSGCKFCMTLIRKLKLLSLNANLRVFTRHVKGKNNFLSDSLSRLKIEKFKHLAAKINWKINNLPTKQASALWPLKHYWMLNCTNLQQ